MMVPLGVVFGKWVRNQNTTFFDVDHSRGGRFYHLSEGCTHSELVGMVVEDYLLDTKVFSVELSYSLPEEMLKQMPENTPHTIVSTDRQVRSLIEFSKSCIMRLCVSIQPTDAYGGGTYGAQCDEYLDEEELGNKLEDDIEGGMDGEDGDGLDNDTESEWEVGKEELEEEAGDAREDADYMKEESYDSDVDYAVYGKLQGEDFDEPDVPFDADQLLPTEKWCDKIEVGGSFPCKNDLLSELRMNAVNQKFAFTSQKSNKTVFVAACVIEGCKWKIRASVKNEPGIFWVTKYVNVHTCSVAERSLRHRRVSARYIGRLFIERVGIIDGIIPKHIKDSMRVAYGIQMDYSTSYRALIFAREIVRGTAESGYDSLPTYLQQVEESNPGSVTDLVRDAENQFKYLFMCLGASIHGFKFLRRILVVDGTHLTGKFGGVLLVAAGQDANFQVFPLAFAVVDAECDDSWDWFFRNLTRCISDQYPLAIVSDRHSSIAKACRNVMPWATRGICYYHLQQNIVSTYHGKQVMHLVRGAAYAYTVAEYDRNMALLRGVKPDIAKYLEDADPKLWARIHFPGHRFTVQTSNIAELINAVVKQAKGFPICYLLEFIRERLTLWFWKRREDALHLTTDFSRGVETLLAIRGHYADQMLVSRIGTWVFHVRYRSRDYTVDLETRRCSCGRYSVEWIPCSHALAALTEAGIDASAYVCMSYSKNSLYGTYSVNIYPKGESSREGIVPLLPPEVRPTPGRKKKSRWQTWLELARKQRPKPRKITKHYNCSKCKKPGHTKPKCDLKD